MPTPRAFATAAYGALVLADTALAGRAGERPARRVTKPLLMPTLAAGLLAARPQGPGVRRTLAAEAFSWGGDVALLGEGRGSFLAGLGSFFGAHVAYVSAFRARSGSPLAGTRGRRRWLAAGGAAAAGMGLAAAREDRALAAPVTAYALALTLMATAAAAVDDDRGRDLTLAGAALFLLSDTLLGARKFLLHDGAPALEAAVMATYTAGQWCIAAGVASGPQPS
ncbi:lysoplasmalogenase [Nocardioides sp.]|uniref:lysoplasmalogenase n=1 Tax=Nocardioides sp. TaxID=35761 RepID=UPI003784573C